MGERYELLEDVLRFLPVLWGPGARAFTGRRLSVPEAICYPRPLQARVPILLGGGGERRTLRLVAELADAANVTGSPDVLARKVGILRTHCEAVGRDPAAVAVTHLSTALVGTDHDDVARRMGALRMSKRQLAMVSAATVDRHVDRWRQLVAAGADHVIVSLPDLSVEAVERLGAVIERARATIALPPRGC